MTKKTQKGNRIMNIFKDMLTEGDRFSQGRVYLFWSVLAYYVTLGILTYSGIRKSDIEMENFRMIVDALEYAMTLFGGYVFGGKFLDVFRAVKGGGNKNTEEEDTKQIL